MTRRLAIAMLATVWAILIAAGVTAYVTTRSVLVANLDEVLVARATPLDASNRYSVKNELGQTVQEHANSGSRMNEAPVMLRAAFVTLGDGQRVRTVSVRTVQRNDAGEFSPVTVTMSESAEPLERLLHRLAWSLVISGGIGGLLAGLVSAAGGESRAASAAFDGRSDRGHRREEPGPADRRDETRPRTSARRRSFERNARAA